MSRIQPVVVVASLATTYDSERYYSDTLLEMLRGLFLSRGADAVTANRRAYAAIFAMVERQAAMLAFNQTYWLLAALFLLMLPLVVLMRRPSHSRGKAVVH